MKKVASVSPRICACGCGDTFETKDVRKVFVNKQHADRSRNAVYRQPSQVTWEGIEDLKHFSRLSDEGKRKVLLGESKFKVAMFDIEATHLKPNVGRIICCSFKPMGGKVYTFGALDKGMKRPDVYDDSRLAFAIRGELERYDIIVGWNCLDPASLVLTDDWHWVPAGSLEVGQGLLAFDEPNGRRAYRRVVVTENQVRKAEAVRVHLSDGSFLVTSINHRWLIGSSGPHGNIWQRGARLKAGTNIPLLIPRATYADSRDAGWLAGILDGEGTQGSYGTVAAYQRPGLVWDRMQKVAANLGIEYSVDVTTRGQLGKGDTMALRLTGGLEGTARILQTLRPERFKGWIPEGQAVQAYDWVQVESVEAIGEQWVSVLGTDGGTYIAEGMGHHNSKDFDVRFINARNLRVHQPIKRAQYHVDGYWSWKSKSAAWAGLAAVQQFLELETSKTTIQWEAWMRVLGWNKRHREDSMAEIVDHCERDVTVLEQAYRVLVENDVVRSIRKDGGIL